MKWQPIETAPKDGTRVLLGGTFYGDAWEMMTGFYQDGIGLKTDGAAGDWIVTHWMPLPAPPTPTP